MPSAGNPPSAGDGSSGITRRRFRLTDVEELLRVATSNDRAGYEALVKQHGRQRVRDKLRNLAKDIGGERASALRKFHEETRVVDRPGPSGERASKMPDVSELLAEMRETNALLRDLIVAFGGPVRNRAA